MTSAHPERYPVSRASRRLRLGQILVCFLVTACQMVGALPSPRHQHGACAVNGGRSLLVLGGALDAACSLWTNCTPFLYDFATEAWSRVATHGPTPAPGPFSFAPFQAASGGRASAMRVLHVGADAVVEGSWDSLALSWAETRAMPRPRGADACRGAAAVADLIVLYGGGNGAEAFGR